MLAVARLHTSVKLAFRLSCYWMRISPVRRRKKSDVIHSTKHSEAVTPSVSGAIRGSLQARRGGLELSSQEVKARGGWMNESPQARDDACLEPGSVVLLRPRGFCAGVIRAIEVVRLAIEILGRPVYVRKEIVHNRHVVDELTAQGAVFVDALDEAPPGAVVIFSAHGVSPEVRQHARRRNLQVIDATCPLVTKVHLEVTRYARDNYTILLIGHRNHDEVIGTLGEAPEVIRVISSVEDVDSLEAPDPSRLAYLTQTTLSIDDTAEIVARLKARFPTIIGPPSQDIC